MENMCIFCNLEDKKIFEDEHFFAVFDLHPVSVGHALLIPKRHILRFDQLVEQEARILPLSIQKTKEIIESSDLNQMYNEMISSPKTSNSKIFVQKMLDTSFVGKRPDGYNIGINEGESAGQTVPHLHIHIIPRYKGDVNGPEGGVRGAIPELRKYAL